MKDHRSFEKKIHKISSDAFSRQKIKNQIKFSTNPKDYIEDEDEYNDIETIDNGDYYE